MKQQISSTKGPKALGPYSAGIASEGLVFLSGQLGVNTEGNLVSEDVVEQTQKARENYLTSVYSTLSEIKDIPLNVNGETVSFVPVEDFRKEMRAISEEPETAYAKYQNEDGSFKDYKGFILDVALYANPTTREKLIEQRIEQAILRDRVAQNKERRNVSSTTGLGVASSGNEAEEAFAQYYAEKQKQQF